MNRTRLAGVLWLLVILGCVSTTINVYFPESAVENAAERIETEVRGIPGATPEKSSAIPSLLWGRAYANVDLNIDTPRIRKIIESRKERFPRVDTLLTDGFAGEANNGYLKEKDRDVYKDDLRKMSDARRLLAEENKDRKDLYLEIARANNAGEELVKDIEKGFARKNRELLKAGQYYEDDAGKWVRK